MWTYDLEFPGSIYSKGGKHYSLDELLAIDHDSLDFVSTCPMDT